MFCDFKKGTQNLTENGSYLPGPAVLTDIISANHPVDDGGVGGQATPVGWETTVQNTVLYDSVLTSKILFHFVL